MYGLNHTITMMMVIVSFYYTVSSYDCLEKVFTLGMRLLNDVTQHNTFPVNRHNAGVICISTVFYLSHCLGAINPTKRKRTATKYPQLEENQVKTFQPCFFSKCFRKAE